MEITINKDFRDYKQALFMGLNRRQCICFVLGIVLAALVNYTLPALIGKDAAGYAAFTAAVPFGAAAFFKYNGLNFEKFAIIWIKQMFITGKERLYHTENSLYGEFSKSKRNNRRIK